VREIAGTHPQRRRPKVDSLSRTRDPRSRPITTYCFPFDFSLATCRDFKSQELECEVVECRKKIRIETAPWSQSCRQSLNTTTTSPSPKVWCSRKCNAAGRLGAFVTNPGLHLDKRHGRGHPAAYLIIADRLPFPLNCKNSLSNPPSPRLRHNFFPPSHPSSIQIIIIIIIPSDLASPRPFWGTTTAIQLHYSLMHEYLFLLI
jgi:hypothetical protein